MAKAYRNVLGNPLEAKTVWRLQQTFLKSEKRRQQVLKKEVASTNRAPAIPQDCRGFTHPVKAEFS